MADFVIGTKKVKISNNTRVTQIHYDFAGEPVKVRPGETKVIEVIDPLANEKSKKAK